MIRKFFQILLLYSISSVAQDDKLRIEIIDVFKEYAPVINNSVKISNQPVFNDTLKHEILPDNQILDKNILLREDLIIAKPSKFRFKSNNLDYNKYLSFALGSKSLISTNFHYNNGMSTAHNSGFYVSHLTEEFLVNKDYDGYQTTSINIYSNRYFQKNMLQTSLKFNNNKGYYWGDLNYRELDSISMYNISDLSLKIDWNQPSNSYVIKNVGFLVNYVSNNYHRNEFIINPFLSFNIEKSLKKYSFKIDLNWIKTNFKNSPSVLLDNLNYNHLSSAHNNNLLDLLLHSTFTVSGAKFLNYEIGLNFQYVPNEDLYFGGDPLLFPKIHLSKKISDTQMIQFNLNKQLIYHSYNHLLDLAPYVDPFYRNALSKELNINILYNKLLSNKLSFASNVNYLISKGSLLPFIFHERYETVFSSEYQNNYLNPIGILLDPVQRGMIIKYSLGLDWDKYNVLFEGELNFIKSVDHLHKSFVPKQKLNSVITMQLFEKINLISNWFFVGGRDALIIDSVYDPETPFSYTYLNKYIDGNISLNYHLNAMVFSLDFKNILGNKIEFFDHYYDDNGLKISLGFLYKF